jgi:alkylation response protein AidB-like acyl-CoA dehydrogenase
MAPREVGGAELAVADLLDVFAEVSRADGSTGWCLMASAGTTAYFGAYSPDEFTSEMFADGVPLAAGQFAPNGVATPTDGGYQVSGNYSFGSGIAHAAWVGAGVFTAVAEGENPELLFCITPAANAVRKGNWDVLGLERTASEDYSLTDVFIPSGATFSFFAPTRRRGGPLYELGVFGLTAIGHAGFAIGVARRALDELASVAKTKHRMGAASALIDSEAFLIELGRLESRYHSARAWTYRAARQAEATVVDGNPASSVEINALRQATVHVTHEAAAIVHGAYTAAGTSALRCGPIERCFRDIHAATQHFFASNAGTLDMARDVLNAAPDSALDADS